MNLSIALLLVLSALSAQAEDIEKISLPLIPDLQRADLYIFKLTEHPTAVLVLSPGFDQNGKNWIQNPLWQKFAREHNLDLVGLSFASDGELLREGRGYYYPRQGSGQLLLDVIDHEFGSDMPLLLYGFSGGAHFTSGFAESKPERVLGWCAYSAEWWDKPIPTKIAPPGLVICGNEDERLGASLIYFKQGRALGKPWLWVGVPGNDHAVSLQAEDFIRRYFAALLNPDDKKGIGQWVDIDFKTVAEEETLNHQPSLTGWLPQTSLLGHWQALHQP